MHGTLNLFFTCYTYAQMWTDWTHWLLWNMIMFHIFFVNIQGSLLHVSFVYNNIESMNDCQISLTDPDSPKGHTTIHFYRACKTSLMNWPPVNCSSVFSKKAYFFPFWKLLEQSLMDGSLCSIGKHWNIVFLLNKAGKSYLAPKVHKFVNNHFYSLFNINMLQ